MCKIDKIVVHGKLPYLLLLEDSLDPDGKTLAKNEFFIFLKQYNIYGVISFKKEINKDSAQYGYGKLLSEDLNGELTYSTFCLIFGDENATFVYDKIKTDEHYFNDRKLAEITVEFINQFLKIYRYHTKKHWIGYTTYIRLSPYLFTLMNDIKGLITRRSADFRGTGESIGNIIDEKTKTLIFKNLKGNLVINDSYKFLMDANRYKIIGDYQSFIVFLAIYIESWISREIRCFFNNNNKSPKEVETFFINKKGYSKNLYNILKDFINDEKDFRTLKNSTEYKEYRSYLAEKRNNIAHGKYTEINKDIAEIIISKAMKYKEFLTRTLFKETFFSNF